MHTFVLALHIVVSLLLVLVILMQPGKGADVSSAFGGGASSQLFGAAGPGNFLTRGTGIIAGIFMCTSIALALMSGDASRTSGGFDGGLDPAKAGQGFGGGASAPPAAPAAPTADPGAAPEGGAISPPPGPAPDPVAPPPPAEGTAAPAVPPAP